VNPAPLSAPLKTPSAPEPLAVAVAMSGGVDSSVAAALLVEQGHRVVGVHMKLSPPAEHAPRPASCCSLDDALDARLVCAKLGIPFVVLDFQQRFQAAVVDPFCKSYGQGKTPNPCVLCNQHIKSRALLAEVRRLGCTHLATGHYAAVRQGPANRWQLIKPADQARDQTYFLFGTPAEELPFLLFPLAGLEKPEARRLAANLGFGTWDKPDSQEICFVPDDYRAFVESRGGGTPPGDLVDTTGRVLGRHQGLHRYTVGQRKGLGLSSPQPLYVVRLDAATNRVVVGEESELWVESFQVEGVNWVSIEAPQAPLEVLVRVRSTHEGQTGRVIPQPNGTARVVLRQPVRGVTPGQAAVFYQENVLLGGGWILPEAP